MEAEATMNDALPDDAPATRPNRTVPVSVPWHGQERRSPSRATNVARLPERTGGTPTEAPPAPHDWEPF